MNLFQLNHKPLGIYKEILQSNAIHFIVDNKKIQWVIFSYRNGLCVIFPKYGNSVEILGRMIIILIGINCDYKRI